jgi:hypothetical protein
MAEQEVEATTDGEEREAAATAVQAAAAMAERECITGGREAAQLANS